MDSISLFTFFTDPILRAPTIGSMLVGLVAGIVGVVVFLRKQSLIGEALSHASYPGVILGVLFAGIFSIPQTNGLTLSLFILIGAFLSAFLALEIIHLLERKLKVPSDAALCFVLSSFFGIGMTMASEVQFSFSSLYRQIQAYLYGQAATMTDVHIIVYGVLASLVLLIIVLFYKELQVLLFDRQFAKSLGVQTVFIENLLSILIVLAVVIGIRSVGVVLMSAMLIAPAAAARQFTHRFSILLILSALFGSVSGYLGNVFSVMGTIYMQNRYSQFKFALPTGPMIVLVASFICLGALLFAPNTGVVFRWIRATCFRYRCIYENLLKTMWRFGANRAFTIDELASYQSSSFLYLYLMMWRLQQDGWVKKADNKGQYHLTSDGRYKAATIVRLHRLWEVYLADYLGVGIEKVHFSAEEIEHILTPELERELTLLLKDPKQDPHHQPIPSLESLNAI